MFTFIVAAFIVLLTLGVMLQGADGFFFVLACEAGITALVVAVYRVVYERYPDWVEWMFALFRPVPRSGEASGGRYEPVVVRNVKGFSDGIQILIVTLGGEIVDHHIREGYQTQTAHKVTLPPGTAVETDDERIIYSPPGASPSFALDLELRIMHRYP